MKYERTTWLIEKGVKECCLCKKTTKGIEVATYPDNNDFVCLHCLIDFLTSDEQVLVLTEIDEMYE